MWKELFDIVTSRPLTREFINCCLRYMVSQPVDIDINMLGYFAIQYAGIEQLIALIQKKKDQLHALLIPAKEETFDVLA